MNIYGSGHGPSAVMYHTLRNFSPEIDIFQHFLDTESDQKMIYNTSFWLISAYHVRVDLMGNFLDSHFFLPPPLVKMGQKIQYRDGHHVFA